MRILRGIVSANAISSSEREIWMLRGEVGEVALDIARCLTDDLQIANDRVLLLLVGKESGMVDVSELPLDTTNGLLDVLQVVN